MENAAYQPQYAGFWIRVGASIIDAIVILIVIGIPLTMIYGREYWASDELVKGVWDVLLSYVLPIVATIWLWLKFRATPGKMLTGIQVVNADTLQTISLGQAIGRYLAYILSTLALGLGFIWVAFSKRKQGWHDMLANTVVIKE